MSLELKHIAPYLPYEAMFQSSMDKPFDEFGKQPIWYIEGLSKLFGNYCLITKNNKDAYEIATCRLVLRPLSDLTKEIEYNGERFVPIKYNAFKIDIDHLIEFQNRFAHYKSVKYGIMERLIEWHFDVFGLIEKGLAIDINTL